MFKAGKLIQYFERKHDLETPIPYLAALHVPTVIW